MAAIELVLWDWNGTLLDDVQLCRQVLNQMLAETGCANQFDTRGYRRIFGFPVQEYYQRAGFDFSRHSFEVLAQRFMDLYIPASFGCPLTPGARGVLAALEQKGLRQVILSASPLDTLQAQTEHLGVQGFFDKLLGLSDIYAKSKVELGVNWMAQSSIDPSRAVMIGDTVHDAEVAAAMGVQCVLYSGGHQPPARLAAAGCPVIPRLSRLPGMLDTL